MSSENGPHSNVIKIFPLDRSEAQMFCISFNNLTVLTGLAMSRKAPYICFFYSNLFGIVQQTAKSSKIAVPIFQFGAANACSAKISTWRCKCSAKFSICRCNCSAKFSNCQFVTANAVPTCSEKYKCIVVAISGKISPFCHRFYSGCKI